MTSPAAEWSNEHDSGDCTADCTHPDHEYEWRANLSICPDSPVFLREMWESISGWPWPEPAGGPVVA